MKGDQLLAILGGGYALYYLGREGFLGESMQAAMFALHQRFMKAVFNVGVETGRRY